MKAIAHIIYGLEIATWRLFGYECRHLKTHRRKRAYALQVALDHEHGTDYARRMAL